MAISKDNMVKVRKNVLLDKNDPDFYRKYLQYKRDDVNIMYQYALQLEQEGEMNKAFSMFQEAASKGHSRSKKWLENKKKEKSTTVIPIAVPEKKKKKDLFSLFLWILMILSLVLAMLLFYLAFSDGILFQRSAQITVYHDNESSSASSVSKKTSKEELPFLVTMSAVENFKNEKGEYPADLYELTGNHPNNWVSSLPDGTSYEKTTDGYALSAKGVDHLSSAGTISLAFYPDDETLAIQRGNETLAEYPVASGASLLPPSSTVVTERVVNPNGGNGALGTRGLALTDGFAIHGTNEPGLIGKKVSHGCIRLKNKDIEIIYPYIPLGTPFHVVKGSSPENVTFPDGLPNTGADVSNETTPDTYYHWKN